MSDVTLRYRDCDLDELAIGECTIRRCRESDSRTDWRLWLRILDEIGADAGAVVLLSVAVDATDGAAYREVDGIKVWALARAGSGAWQIAPSIDAKDIWHHTPLILGAPADPPWAHS